MLALVAGAPSLTETEINIAKSAITNDETSKLIGQISHLAYWMVFGHINPLPLDKYHSKQLFISIAQIISSYESKYSQQKKVFVTFLMPMMILAIRIEVELIFKNTYKVFFSKEQHEKVSFIINCKLISFAILMQIAIKLLNDVITSLVDPNLYFSRFSFFESGKEAINIKI